MKKSITPQNARQHPRMLTPTEDGMMTVITPAITRADDMMMSRALCTLLKSFVIIICLFRVIDVRCPSVALNGTAEVCCE